MNFKGVSSAVSEENKEPVIGSWRKGNLCYLVAENLADLCPASCVESKPVNKMNWDIHLRRFPHEVLNVWPDFFLVLLVKCEKEVIWEKNC